MPWTTQRKDLGVANTVSHPPRHANVIGRTPTAINFQLTSFELFGAAARCSHLHLINPAIATPELTMVAKLIEQHVDNYSPDFAILSTADNLKDFVKSYFAGTVASGLAYLAMINEGYVWSDHFENIGGGNPTVRRQPDFVFADAGGDVAIVESKGTRSASSSSFGATVRDGYEGQVEPHLGHIVGGTTATHGYCIGAHMQSTTSADLRIHYTDPPGGGGGGGGGGSDGANTGGGGGGRNDADNAGDNQNGSLGEIQRNSFATAFSLAHGPELGLQLRLGEGPYQDVPFFRFHWLGRTWLSSLGFQFSPGPSNAYIEPHLPVPHDLYHRARPPLIFAVEQTVAEAALRRFLNAAGEDHLGQPIPPMNPEVRQQIQDSPGEYAGAVFPDGLAILDPASLHFPPEFTVWNIQNGEFLG
jgi:hypothetical protein